MLMTELCIEVSTLSMSVSALLLPFDQIIDKEHLGFEAIIIDLDSFEQEMISEMEESTES